MYWLLAPSRVQLDSTNNACQYEPDHDLYRLSLMEVFVMVFQVQEFGSVWHDLPVMVSLCGMTFLHIAS